MGISISNEDRARREKAYHNLALGYERMVSRMWEELDTETQAPKLVFDFEKTNACATFWFTHDRQDNTYRSHLYVAGHISDPKEERHLVDLETLAIIPYFIAEEIFAATIIASLVFSYEDKEEKDEFINDLLNSYYECEEYSPIEISTVWVSRLNTTVCNIWRLAPIMQKTFELMHEKQINITDAQTISMDEAVIPEPPQCMTSNNNDGRMNMSYENSKFYTIDHYGIAICAEFPNELLNLNDYSTMAIVASTICNDIAGNETQNNLGVSGAYGILKEEPKWMNENLFPWERDEQNNDGRSK